MLFGGHIYAVLSRVFLGIGQRICIYLASVDTAKQFAKVFSGHCVVVLGNEIGGWVFVSDFPF